MANVKYTDADGSTRESYSSKAGSAGDPDLSPETLHNDLVTIHGDVDGLEALVTSTNTKLDTVHTDLGTLLTTGTPITGQSLESGGAGGLGWLSSVRKKLSDLIALLPTALGQTTMANSLAVTIASNQSAIPASQSGTWTVQPGNTANTTPWKVDGSAVTQPVSGTVTAAASENHVGEIGGNLVSVATEFTRPADTLAYTAGDVVSDSTSATTMQALANAARVSGGSGYIVGIKISTDKKSITPRLRVHFFGTNGATIAADNVAYKEVYADGSKRLFYYDMPAMTTAADTTNSDMSRSVDTSMRIPYICAATSLYYVLETLDAFTPASGQKITVTTFLDRN